MHSDLKTIDPIHTFDVPINFTRSQLEKMLLTVDAEGDTANTQTPASEQSDATMAIAVKKAFDLIDITKHTIQSWKAPHTL